MSDALRALGIDLETLEWQDLSLCNGMDTNLFFDDYEADEQVARMIDDACLSCPVFAQCLERGMENGEWGVWGAIYLDKGKPDTNRNAHKTPEIWAAIKERLGGE